MSHVQVEPKALKTVGCVGVFLVTDARSATVDLLIGSGSIRGALPSTCVSAAREAGQLDVVLRRVETGADPAYDLAVDYDRKTASGPPSEAHLQIGRSQLSEAEPQSDRGSDVVVLEK